MKRLIMDMLLLEQGKAYGFQEFSLNLLDYLYEHRDEVKFDKVIIVCMESQQDMFSRYADKFETVGYPCQSMYKRFYLQTMFPLWLKVKKCDLVYYPGNYTGLIKRGQVLLTIHDLLFKRKQLLPKPLMRLQRNLYLPVSVRYADKIIAISKFTRDDVIAHYPKAQDKTETIYNYFNFKKYAGAVSAPHHNYFLSVCSEEIHKNTITLLHAYEAYCQQGGDKQLIMVGKIIPDSAVAKKLESLPAEIRQRITTCVHITNQQLAALYQGADAYISASLFEGLGMPVVEAMYFNKPVIVSDIPVLHEVSMEHATFFAPLDPQSLVQAMLCFKKSDTDTSQLVVDTYSSANTSRRYLQCINQFALNSNCSK
ncbi:MAG: glycosyltransferase family 4 protein [Prevotella sp.]|nr:glycosyltransferase family 4 protein [Prevotella sp.]